MAWQANHGQQEPSADVPRAFYGGQPPPGVQAANELPPQQAPAAPIDPPVPDVAQLKPGQLQALVVAAIAEAEHRRRKRRGIGASGVIAAVAAIAFALAGIQLVSLQSVAGNTVAEAFYNGVGVMCFGLAALSIVIGTRE